MVAGPGRAARPRRRRRGSNARRGAAVSSGQLAPIYGFTDIDGSQPDVWRFIEEIRDRGLDADPEDYR